jgi:hypothetical protein
MRIEVNEDDLLATLLSISPEFRQFYREERLKKVGLIRWFRDFNLEKSMVAQADIFECAICFGRSPTSLGDAHVMAHEIMHIIRAEEKSILQIKFTKLSYYPLAISLASMIEDPTVDAILYKQYNFDLTIQYNIVIDNIQTHAKKEPNDKLSQIRSGFFFANDTLRWNLINDQDALDKHVSYLVWFESQYPNIYKIGVDTANVVREIGLDTVEQHKAIVTKLVDKYNLQDIIRI